MARFIVEQNNPSVAYNFLSYSRFKQLPSSGSVQECTASYDELCRRKELNVVSREDLVYLNLSFADELNADPEKPDFGWKIDGNGHLISLNIEYQDGSSLQIPDVRVIAPAYQVGSKNGKSFQRIAIDMEDLAPLLTDNCFAIIIEVQKSLNDPEPLVCYYGIYKLAESELSADDPLCPQTVLIEGVYFGFDCDRQWYGSFGEGNVNGSSNYESRVGIRLNGTLEIQGFRKEIQETDFGAIIKTEVRETAQLRLYPMSQATAKKLAHILAADVLLVNGEEWIERKGLNKNNGDNEKWLPVIELERLTCVRDSLGCS